ncbi:unnamed protein product [Cyclocybe aegerita]|uniref:Uncharacterized protein n=1 Tax=Cyclocybe aegerita TaxID=1973307 RepID=A0A8S0XQU8_CYCAE|nr:unnamed protein product [Cyclocybe aegerita]
MAQSLQRLYGIQHLVALIILFTTTFATLSFAAPIDVSPDTSSLIARHGQCPSIDSMRQHIRNKGMSTNTVFYMKPASAMEAGGFAGTLTPPGKFFGSFVTFDDQMNWVDACGGNTAEQEKIVIHVSIALAREASGTAYILTKGAINPTSIWTRYEFPALQRNPRIIEVHEFNLDTQTYTLIWRGGDIPTLPENVV